MEAVGWIRALGPAVGLAVLAGMGLGRPPALGAADPPWEPPPCAVAGGSAAPPAASAWYRMDAVLDATGTLAGQRLTLGTLGGRSRHLDLPPESFASGPLAGRLLVGDDDGSASRLRVVDVDQGCANAIERVADVIRSAVASPVDGSIWEHRVDRVSRTDLGVWRLTPGGDTATRVLPGQPPDDRYGPTFATELRWAKNGRLGIASCGELACRTRLLEPATGRVVQVESTGPMIGAIGDRVVAYDLCHGFPCGIIAVDGGTGRRTTLVDDAGPAAMSTSEDPILVFGTARGGLETLDLRTGTRRPVTGGAGLLPLGTGSTASSAIAATEGRVPVIPDGRVMDPSDARAIDLQASEVVDLGEATR